MKEQLLNKLNDLPTDPGVYYHFNQAGQIIYVGKATNLRHRVRQYFNQTASIDLKNRRLREEIANVRWTTTLNAPQALLLESEMIKRYQPKYNVLERNQTSCQGYYVAFNWQKSNPHLQLSKTCLQADSQYLGPFTDSRFLKQVLKCLRQHFPFSTHRSLPKKACLDHHLGLCPGPETANFDPEQAWSNLKRVQLYLEGKQTLLLRQLRQAMQQAAQKQRYELAAQLRDQIEDLVSFKAWIKSFDFQKLNLATDQALVDLKELFNFKQWPSRIETYDISHLSGSQVVASMVVAQQGILRPNLQRRFKAPINQNNDYAQIETVLKRRFSSKSLSDQPDLILIDGGGGQVSSALKVLQNFNLKIPVLGLAKKREEIFFKSDNLSLNLHKLKQLKGSCQSSPQFSQISLPLNTPLIKLMQRLRDASHRLAVNYHRFLRKRYQTKSTLLDLPGIGPKTYRRLMRHFGSLASLKQASLTDLKQVVNQKQLAVLKQYLNLNQAEN